MGGGGTAEPIPPWDLASLIGATLLIGTVLMVLGRLVTISLWNQNQERCKSLVWMWGF